MAVRARPTSSPVIDIGTGKMREVRQLARRLEARAGNKTLARSLPQLRADLLSAARELRNLCRALEVAGKDSITIKSAPDPNRKS
jgi:hypothetical protein